MKREGWAMKNAYLFTILLTVGCGGADFETASVDSEFGDAGTENVPNENNVGNFGGSTTATGTTTETSSGGNLPINPPISTGGSVNSGGNSTGGMPNAGGSENSGGTPGAGNTGNTCVPKTCATIGVELSGGDLSAESCGIAPDGCNGYINCGGCSNPNHKCGETTPTKENWRYTRDGYPGVQNVCGGGCAPIELGAEQACYTGFESILWACTVPNIPLPGRPSCESTNSGYHWCCPI